MLCKYCGTPEELDPSDGMDYCPNQCSQEIFRENHMNEEALISPEQKNAESEDLTAEPPEWAILEQTHCWVEKCLRSTKLNQFARTPQNSDAPYGNFCPACGESLRQHPFWGQGQEYNRGNPQCVNAWRALTKQEKAQVYARYKFPIPKWLL